MSHYTSFFRLIVKVLISKEDYLLEEGSTYNLELSPKLSKEMGLRTYFIRKKNGERTRTDGQKSATASM